MTRVWKISLPFIILAVATALATSGIACNVIAGLRHDHLFVPWDRREEALKLLEKLSLDARR